MMTPFGRRYPRRSRREWSISRPRARRTSTAMTAERLEGRALLSVMPTPVTIAPIEGSSFTGTVSTFTTNDPGLPNPNNYSATINWGDSSPTTAGAITFNGTTYVVTGTHTYTVGKPFTGSVTIADAVDSTTASSALAAAVVNVAPTFSQTTIASSVTEGAPAGGTPPPLISGTLSDPGTDPLTLAINWGDGSSPTTLTLQPGRFSNSHVYTRPGSYTITATATDTTPASSTITGAIVVGDAPPTITPVPVVAAQGVPFSGAVATFTDVDTTLDISKFSSVIVWGDGTSSAGTISEDPTTHVFTVSGMHTYTSSGTFPAFAVTVTDYLLAKVSTAGIVQTNLASDGNVGSVPSAQFDPNLIDPRGIGVSTQDVSWLADYPNGFATMYNSNGSPLQLVVAIPPNASSEPIGVVFNPDSSTGAFSIGGGNTFFLFSTAAGTISGWGGGINAFTAVDNSASGAVYTGLTLLPFPSGTGQAPGSQDRIYAANFHSGKVEVYNASFQPIVSVNPNAFVDPTLPAGYEPFNVRAIAGAAGTVGAVFVTYALPDGTGKNAAPGPGSGYIDEFDQDGTFLRRIGSAGSLNAPWGIAQAPSTFAQFGGALLVANTGDGLINAYNQNTGVFLGQLTSNNTGPVTIDGLWGINFGAAGTADANKLFFSAGPGGRAHGLFGSLTNSPTSPAVVTPNLISAVGDSITAHRGISTGQVALATFTYGETTLGLAGLTATINWGDGAVTTGVVTQPGGPGTPITVLGTHTYASDGTFHTAITLAGAPGAPAVADGSATVTEAGLTFNPGITFNYMIGVPVGPFTVADFYDLGGNLPIGSYTAAIDWGDGTTSPGALTPAVLTVGGSPVAGFAVAGSHTYAAAGGHTVQVTVTSTLGASGSVANTALQTFPPLPPPPPPVTLTADGTIDPFDDTGIANYDRITNINTPDYIGTATLGTVVRLYVQPVGSSAAPTLVGTTNVNALGEWRLTTSTLADGAYNVYVNDALPDGSKVITVPIFPLAVDTHGPVVTGDIFVRNNGVFLVTFQDAFSGLVTEGIFTPSNFSVSLIGAGGSSTPLPVTLGLVTPTSTALNNPYTVAVYVNGGRRLPPGDYLLHVSSAGIIDRAGNHLDGQYYGYFPSGNRAAGGGTDFQASSPSTFGYTFAPAPTTSTPSPLSPPGITPLGYATPGGGEPLNPAFFGALADGGTVATAASTSTPLFLASSPSTSRARDLVLSSYISKRYSL